MGKLKIIKSGKSYKVIEKMPSGAWKMHPYTFSYYNKAKYYIYKKYTRR